MYDDSSKQNDINVNNFSEQDFSPQKAIIEHIQALIDKQITKFKQEENHKEIAGKI